MRFVTTTLPLNRLWLDVPPVSEHLAPRILRLRPELSWALYHTPHDRTLSTGVTFCPPSAALCSRYDHMAQEQVIDPLARPGPAVYHGVILTYIP